MATELFKLMGRITIDMDDAESDLNRFTTLLEGAVSALNRMDTNLSQVNGALNTIDGNISEVVGELGSLNNKADVANSSLNTMKSRTNAAGKEFKELDTKLNGIGKTFGVDGALGAGAVWLGNILEDLTYKVLDLSWEFMKIGINFNASAESYQASFKTMLGVTEREAAALYEKLREFAVETPYSMEGVAESAVRLFNAGYDFEGTMETLEVLGNIAGGDSQKLERLIKAFTDTKGYGFLKAQERNQFVENGVLIYDLLADYYDAIGQGVYTADELATMQADKAISSGDVWNALVLSTTEGYRYYNAMSNLMDTYKGQMEKTGDQLDETSGAFTLPVFETLKNETMPEANRLLEEFKVWATENEASIKEVAETISAIAIEGLEGLSTLLQFYITNKDTILPVFSAIAIALTAVFAAGHPLIALFAAINAGIVALIENKEELENWISNSGFGGVVNVTEKETDVRGLTHEYLGMKAKDYANDEAYQAARVEKLAQIEKAYSDLVMRVAASENKEELSDALGMSTSEYLSLMQADIQALYKEGATLADLKLLNTLSPLWHAGNTRDALGLQGEYFESPYTIGEDGKLYLTNPAALANEKGRSFNPDEVISPGTSEWFNEIGKGIGSFFGMYNQRGGGSRWEEITVDDYSGWTPGLRTMYSDPRFNLDGNNSGNVVAALATQVAGLTNAVQSLTGEIPDAISSGISGISVTGHITTGNVVLDSGAVVGELTPKINMSLGDFYAVSYRDD